MVSFNRVVTVIATTAVMGTSVFENPSTYPYYHCGGKLGGPFHSG